MSGRESNAVVVYRRLLPYLRPHWLLIVAAFVPAAPASPVGPCSPWGPRVPRGPVAPLSPLGPVGSFAKSTGCSEEFLTSSEPTELFAISEPLTALRAISREWMLLALSRAAA